MREHEHGLSTNQNRNKTKQNKNCQNTDAHNKREPNKNPTRRQAYTYTLKNAGVKMATALKGTYLNASLMAWREQSLEIVALKRAQKWSPWTIVF